MILFAASKTMANLEFDPAVSCSYFNKDKTLELVKKLSDYDKAVLSKKMKLSDKVTDITFDYYQNFGCCNARAIEIYSGLSFRQITVRNCSYESSNVCIISGLYGIVSGSDFVSRYRLDFTMNKIVDVNLYQLWSSEVTQFLNNNSATAILNLCSNEYFKVVDKSLLNKPVFSLECVEKMHSTDLKKLRGQVLNYCIENEIIDYKQLIEFKTKDYKVVSMDGFIINVAKTL